MILATLGSRLRQLDWVLFALSIILVSFGLAALYSVSIGAADLDLSRLFRQMGFAIVGIAIMLAVSFFDYRMLHTWRNALYVIGAVSLVGVLVFGTVIRETQRWFTVFGITIQPSEFVKLFLIIFLAGALSAQMPLRGYRPVVLSGIATLLFMVLLFLQPDAGSALIYFSIWLSLLLVTRINVRTLLILSLILVLATGALWSFVLRDYQKERVQTFFNPASDPLGVGYNVTQSVIAVGSGQLLGRGLGLGPQSQLNFLPEQETDFIFAVIAEELGLFGVVILLVFFVLFIMRMLRIARRCRDPFSLILVLGIAASFTIQITVNVGMNVGLLPVTGIPLPLVSAGGSSLIANLLSIGLLQSIALRQRSTLPHA